MNTLGVNLPKTPKWLTHTHLAVDQRKYVNKTSVYVHRGANCPKPQKWLTLTNLASRPYRIRARILSYSRNHHRFYRKFFSSIHSLRRT